MSDLKTFWSKWKVFILGGLAAAALAINELFVNPPAEGEGYNTKVIVVAAVMALLSYISKEWRGKTGTILGMIGLAAGIIGQQLATGDPVNWFQLLITIVVAYLASVSAPPKADTYERDATIVEAKKVPAVNQTDEEVERIPPANKDAAEYGNNFPDGQYRP